MHTYSKIKTSPKGIVTLPIPVNETAINETFAPTNNILGEFRELSSSLFLLVFEEIVSITENLIK